MNRMPTKKANYLLALAGLSVLIALIYFGVAVKGANAMEAYADLSDVKAQLIVQLEPNHPYLAEYRRFVIIRKDDIEKSRLEMSLDTGGFARTQLYRFPDGRIVIQGFLDSAILNLPSLKLTRTFEANTSGSTYIGAFDKDREGNWKFMKPDESPEQELVASGG